MHAISHPHLPTFIPAHQDRVGRRTNPGGWAACGFLFATEHDAWVMCIAVAREIHAKAHPSSEEMEFLAAMGAANRCPDCAGSQHQTPYGPVCACYGYTG